MRKKKQVLKDIKEIKKLLEDTYDENAVGPFCKTAIFEKKLEELEQELKEIEG